MTEGSDKDLFRKLAVKVSNATGKARTFALALGLILVWGATGPMFGFSDTWQLVINTGTTIITFLMVFLIQNTQNRDSRALQLKLDELIQSQESAKDDFIDLEDLSDQELDELEEKYFNFHKKIKEKKERRFRLRKK